MRRRVAERIGAGAVAVIAGACAPGSHDQFRQSNELLYLCGVEVPHAYLVIRRLRRRGRAVSYRTKTATASGRRVSTWRRKRGVGAEAYGRGARGLPMALRGAKPM